MAANFLQFPIFSLFLILLTFATSLAEAELELVGSNSGAGLVSKTLEWGFQPQYHLEPETIEREEDEDEDSLPRRSLYWNSQVRRRYYISYGALSAGRIPCPARSGRSYYTHNCFRARGPVNPYSRSCSAITRCRS